MRSALISVDLCRVTHQRSGTVAIEPPLITSIGIAIIIYHADERPKLTLLFRGCNIEHRLHLLGLQLDSVSRHPIA
jgi:hypothetical protein